MRILWIGMLALALPACSSSWNEELPSTAELGSPRGYRIGRTIIHLHSPLSHDACDGSNVSDPDVARECLDHLRLGICKNRIDFAMLTDHPSKMVDFNFSDLFQARTGDELILQGADVIASRITCESQSHSAILAAGYEDQLMPIGMTQHLASTPEQRLDKYRGNDAAAVTDLKTNADAVVIVPHTESRSLDLLRTLNMDAIEIYNIHANLDPKIRQAHLGFGYFDGVPDLIAYWIDPYREQQPDIAFLSFMRFASVYFEKWNTLIGESIKVAGVAGSDSHENTLKWSDSKGERLDSHRRMLRWFSNHYLVSDLTPALIKAAIRAGRGWVVVEGLGSPVGMDFYAATGAQITGVGETGTLVAGQTRIYVPLPTIHSSSPQDGNKSKFVIRLKRVTSGGKDQVEAEAENAALEFAPTVAGAYRAEISMVPEHLKSFMQYKRKEYIKETPWIITNHLYLQ